MTGIRAKGSSGASRKALASIALMAIAIAGCPRPPPTFGPEPYEEAEAVLRAVRERQLRPEAIIADARVRVAGPDGRGSADHFIVVRRPADLRFETLSFFGSPMTMVLVTGDRFLLWEIEENRAWEGSPTAETFGIFIPVGMEPKVVADMLVGMPPVYESRGRLKLDHDRGRYVVGFSRGPLAQHLVVRPDDYSLEIVEWLDQDATVLARLEYDRYREVDGKLFPYEIRYETVRGTQLRVRYRDVTFNPPDADVEVLFEGGLPEHVIVRPVDPGAPPQLMMPED